MKKIMLLTMLLVVKMASAQYKPVDKESVLKFKIQNFGFDVTGMFSGMRGNIHFDPQNLANDTFDVSVDAATVNTNNDLRDSHLRGDGYFDVKNYPVIRFVSGKVRATNKKGVYLLMGTLTIKDKSKSLSFPFTASSVNNAIVFKGNFRINRKDFDIGGVSSISDELEISLNVIAKK